MPENKINQRETPLFDAVMNYLDKSPAYFRIPGHRFEKGINKKWIDIAGGNIFRMDLTETPLLDDLHNPGGPILEAELLASELFGSEKTFFLVNGTTCGNEAMILSLCCGGGEIIIPRNAHKSVLAGLILSGGTPVFVSPEYSKEAGVPAGVAVSSIEKAIADHPWAKGVFLVSPTYHGLCSDISASAELCRRQGVPLVVDEAHGAHCYFSPHLPGGALTLGADACIQSIHKVTGSLTQSSMLHIASKRISEEAVAKALHLVQSTSPSYLLMVSLDLARQDLALRGREMADKALDLAGRAREEIGKISGINCYGRELAGNSGIFEMDPTRLIISARDLGISGFELKKVLFEEYRVDTEMADWYTLLGIVTYANEREDLERLTGALKDISNTRRGGKPLSPPAPFPARPPQILSPRQAFYSLSRVIPWKEAKGKVSTEMIAPYPPGIPAVYPGEEITGEIWDYLEEYRKEKRHLHGPSDPELAKIRIADRLPRP